MLNRLFNKFKRMPFELVVFESFDCVRKGIVREYIKKSIPVYFIEPFVAYHIKKGPYHGFAGTFPDYIEQLLQKDVLKLLPADSIDGKSIYRQATDKAVEVIESVFPEYRKEHKELFEYVSDTLQSSVAENVFKKNLCNGLAEFYSVNILLHRIGKFLGSDRPILFYPDTNVRSYLKLKALISKSNQKIYEHPNIRFPVRTHIAAFFENLKEYLLAISRLSAQTLASGLLGHLRLRHKKKKKSYTYGVTIISPTRQIADNQRGPDFIIDNSKIHAHEVVYFPLCDLTSEQKKRLGEMSGEVFYPPGVKACFTHFAKWRKLLWLAFKKNLLRNGKEIDAACNALINYFRWQKVLENVEFQHLITHCDFGVNHIGRNLALNQAGKQTWYFTDSINFGCNMNMEGDSCNMRHPSWTYLYYDHFVTWDELLARYFREHPATFKHVHVVGCLWSEHAIKKDKTNNVVTDSVLKNLDGAFKLAFFDTTYSRKGFCAYEEGLAFAEHILQLAEDLQDVYIFFKEKKQRNIHYILDPVLGPRLLDLYRKMDTHSKIKICPDREDASYLISVSDMVISFPFTSTTFEALSVNKPAIWHDPLDCYKGTPYAEAGGIMTHSYEELKAKVMEIKNMQANFYNNPIPINSPLMDPYRDGKAIDRFRELLST